ncbi:DNA ligase [Luteimonas sp. RD2P54]|uniref:DNA ligase n=1 Tax=Luteimonas endophytica TaxID=3042023 RepID=A0ABT6J789_9GAMM|nr:DNA ligase [Luteimonas endophytica]MDH5822442.1 DNA ligase [Luteimonas endophytica]
MRQPFAALLSLLLWTVVPAVSAATPPRLMLATRYEPGLQVADYWVSEKLDGVRGRWDGRALWTRGGNPVDAPAWFTRGWPAEPMDGELWIGRGRFEEVSGLVRAGAADAAAWRRVRFMVFDLPQAGGAFGGRVVRMRELTHAAGVPWLQPVPQRRLPDAAALEARLRAVVAAGGEGLMLHHGEARYRVGRSDRLLKLKPFDDAEARVVAHLPGQGKYAGMTGSLLVERADGMRFRLGSGLSDAQRAAPPPIGSHVTYRYSGLTVNGVPRFARFLRVRPELPPADPE